MAEPDETIAKPSILVVDDEPELLDELREAMLAAGWEVSTASNAATACRCLEADDDIAVVLSDIRMPGMDGLCLAQRVGARRGEAVATEVVLLTGHGVLDDAAKAARIGAFDLLSKPVGLKLLLDTTGRAYRSAVEKRRREAARLATLP